MVADLESVLPCVEDLKRTLIWILILLFLLICIQIQTVLYFNDIFWVTQKLKFIPRLIHLSIVF